MIDPDFLIDCEIEAVVCRGYVGCGVRGDSLLAWSSVSSHPNDTVSGCWVEKERSQSSGGACQETTRRSGLAPVLLASPGPVSPPPAA